MCSFDIVMGDVTEGADIRGYRRFRSRLLEAPKAVAPELDEKLEQEILEILRDVFYV